MDLIALLVDYILPFLVILTVVVFVHELGHYWVARRAGVRIEVFSIGFGSELWGWTDRAGTRWRLSAVPLGGYVKMYGETDSVEEEAREHGDQPPQRLSDEDRAASFQYKSLGWRAAVVAAGPFANFVFAVVVFAAMFALVGQTVPHAAVGDVRPDTAAEEAGFRTGDRILSIDGQRVEWFSDLSAIVAANPGRALGFEVVRDGRAILITATPRTRTLEDGRKVGFLGVGHDPAQVSEERMNPFKAAWTAVDYSVALTATILKGIGELIMGERDTKELGGVLRIAQFSGEAAQDGMLTFFRFAAILSLHLCLINLFPIPMLDGGHLAFYAVEAVRGKPLGLQAQEYGFRLGLILVIALFVFATWNDLVHLRVIQFLKDLIT